MKEWTWLEFGEIPMEKRNGCFKFNHTNADVTVWYKCGLTHRLDGPAIEYTDGRKFWIIEGKQYSEEEFKIKSFVLLNNLEKFS
jgi:hypothetical protein